MSLDYSLQPDRKNKYPHKMREFASYASGDRRVSEGLVEGHCEIADCGTSGYGHENLGHTPIFKNPGAMSNFPWIDRLGRWPRGWLLVLLVVMTFCVRYLDYATGERYSANILYFPIIALTCWLVGLWPAIALSLVESVLWIVGDLVSPTSAHDAYRYWDTFARFLVYSSFAYVLWRLRASMAHERQLSRYDELTGLANRTSLFEIGKRDLAWCRQANKPITAVFIDLDEFKEVNDNYGHAAGDEVLRLTADCLQAHTRRSDVTARIGGDEFVVLAPEMSAEAAQGFIERMQKRLRETMQQHRWPVTFSIGAATYNYAPLSLDELIKSADDLMYAVKRREKNSIKHAVIDVHRRACEAREEEPEALAL